MSEEKMLLLGCWLAYFGLVGIYFYLSRQLKNNIISKYLGIFQYTLWSVAVIALGGLILTRSWAFWLRWGFALSTWVWVGFALWAQLRMSRRLVKITSFLQTQIDKDRNTWKDVNLTDEPFTGSELDEDNFDVN